MSFTRSPSPLLTMNEEPMMFVDDQQLPEPATMQQQPQQQQVQQPVVTANPSLLEMRTPPPNLRSVPFPWRLHEMLDASVHEGFESIVGWLPDGRSFRVHEPTKFVDKVMKKFFNQNKYKSFQRQLNIWGFVRILDGPMKGGYFHQHLMKGQPELCSQMKRQKIKGTATGGAAAAATTVNAAMVAAAGNPAVVAAAAAAAAAASATTTVTQPPATIFAAAPVDPNQQQPQHMMRSTSVVTNSTSTSDSVSVSSDTSSLTTPMFGSEQPLQLQQQQQQQQPYMVVNQVAQPLQYQLPQQQLQLYDGTTTTGGDAGSTTSDFEGQNFFLLGGDDDMPKLAPNPAMEVLPALQTTTTTAITTAGAVAATDDNTYRHNRRLSVQLFAASQGESTGMPGIEQFFADLEAGTDALTIFNRSIAC